MGLSKCVDCWTAIGGFLPGRVLMEVGLTLCHASRAGVLNLVTVHGGVLPAASRFRFQFTRLGAPSYIFAFCAEPADALEWLVMRGTPEALVEALAGVDPEKFVVPRGAYAGALFRAANFGKADSLRVLLEHDSWVRATRTLPDRLSILDWVLGSSNLDAIAPVLARAYRDGCPRSCLLSDNAARRLEITCDPNMWAATSAVVEGLHDEICRLVGTMAPDDVFHWLSYACSRHAPDQVLRTLASAVHSPHLQLAMLTHTCDPWHLNELRTLVELWGLRNSWKTSLLHGLDDERYCTPALLATLARAPFGVERRHVLTSRLHVRLRQNCTGAGWAPLDEVLRSGPWCITAEDYDDEATAQPPATRRRVASVAVPHVKRSPPQR